MAPGFARGTGMAKRECMQIRYVHTSLSISTRSSSSLSPALFLFAVTCTSVLINYDSRVFNRSAFAPIFLDHRTSSSHLFRFGQRATEALSSKGFSMWGAPHSCYSWRLKYLGWIIF